LPGLADLSAPWPGANLTLSLWAMAPSADLGGRSPWAISTEPTVALREKLKHSSGFRFAWKGQVEGNDAPCVLLAQDLLG
jgi:hypothetical protein